MGVLTDEQARNHIIKLLTVMVQQRRLGSVHLQGLSAEHEGSGRDEAAHPAAALRARSRKQLATALMNPRQRDDFVRELECNFAMSVPGVSRFRVNVFQQQLNVGMVIRTIANDIPELAKLGLPENLQRDRR